MKKMSKKKKALINKMVIISSLFLLIGVYSYAWFESLFDPIIFSDNFRITASDGLFIQLSDNDDAQRVNVKEVARDLTEEFGLAQVSTVDSVNFFKRTSNSGYATFSPAEKNSDYIEIYFMISGDTEIYGTYTPSPDRYIYLKSFSLDLVGIDGEVIPDSFYAADAIRVNLDYQLEVSTDVYQNDSYLICRDNPSNVGNRLDEFQDDSHAEYSSSIIKKILKGIDSTPYDGYELYSAIKDKGIESDERYGTQRVYFGSQFIYNEAGPKFSQMVCIPNGKGIKVTLTVWLEGADPRCDLPISGSNILMDMVFGSYYYKIDFDSNGGQPVTPLIFNEVGKQAGTLPTPVSNDGRTFAGWYEDISVSSTKWDEFKVVDKNVTLYAKWN